MQNVSFLPCRCLTIIACVFCVCVCRVCFPILFNPVCFCVIDLLSNPGHLARLPLWRVDHQHQRSQNFLYFQNQHQLRHWRGGVGGLTLGRVVAAGAERVLLRGGAGAADMGRKEDEGEEG